MWNPFWDDYSGGGSDDEFDIVVFAYLMVSSSWLSNYENILFDKRLFFLYYKLNLNKLIYFINNSSLNLFLYCLKQLLLLLFVYFIFHSDLVVFSYYILCFFLLLKFYLFRVLSPSLPILFQSFILPLFRFAFSFLS